MKRGRGNKTPVEAIDKMVALYEAGFTGSAIGSKLGCCQSNVFKYLSERGVDMSRKIQADESYARLAKNLREEGLSWKMIVRKIGFSESTLRRAVKAL